MYGNLLLCVDYDGIAGSALPPFASLARLWNARVHVLHVHRRSTTRPNGGNRRLVHDIVDRLNAAGVPAMGEVHLTEDDHLVPAIAQAARSSAADLVAIGTRGRSASASLLTGSVSHRVAAAVSLPVLVVRPNLRSLEQWPAAVLAAVDAGEDRWSVLDTAARTVQGTGGEAVVVHVLERHRSGVFTDLEPAERGQELVDAAVADLRSREVRARGLALRPPGGSVAQQLVKEAERLNCALLILGSRRPGELEAVVTGSVAHEVSRRTRRPLLLAPRRSVPEVVGDPGEAVESRPS
jgi:nucleotide-binding universal stress UspA family protein